MSLMQDTDHLHPLSSSPCYRWKYDVFLSFRGPDTRRNFVSHLYAALIRQRIKVFKDDRTILIGRSVCFSILKAIEESRISIVVLSQDYGRSDDCLDELLKILECRQSMGRYVYPVFYHVEPEEVRHQRGCFHDGFAVQGNHIKLSEWRNALDKVTRLAGIKIEGDESDCITGIVATVLKDMGPRRFPMISLLGYWRSLSFLKLNNIIGARQVGSAGLVSSTPTMIPNEVGAIVYDQSYKNVHKGRLNKEVVDIKEMHVSTMRDSDSKFLEEVSIRSRMKHENVAKVFGYCIRGTRRFLVEEHATNGTLHQILHGAGSTSVLGLMQRVKIVCDIAKGVQYLHGQNRLVHIDSSNVLLFANFNAKISTGSSTSDNYRAPEYNEGDITVKGDVYGFGVLLFELFTGRKPSRGIVKSVFPTGKVDNLRSLIDPKLKGQHDSREAKKLVDAMLSATSDQPSAQIDISTILEYFNRSLAVQ